jgi:hypothetical protein
MKWTVSDELWESIIPVDAKTELSHCEAISLKEIHISQHKTNIKSNLPLMKWIHNFVHLIIVIEINVNQFIHKLHRLFPHRILQRGIITLKKVLAQYIIISI